MIVSVASGKGGTGKTTVTASLASVWDSPLQAVDLDVEEPNLHLFLAPDITGRQKAPMPVPVVEEALCTHCGACSDLCQFKAISDLKTLVLTFPEMCHGCGGCMAVCPEKAISKGSRELGEISWGQRGKIGFLMGKLRVGEAMSPPLMRQVKARLNDILAAKGGDAIIDAPPGVSCPAVNAVMDSDVIILVTEPTPFGFYDFELAWRAFSPFGKPMGAVINRAGIGNDAVYDFCRGQGIPVLAQIPYDRTIAEAYSRGSIIAETSNELRQLFVTLMVGIRDLASRGRSQEAAHA
ncbi:MAG: 4Fe-4S binding protein [Syntrophobacteraceae bacterium]